ncbi:MAG: hypothetical protein EXS35_01295 [Pedosphaera sp.]|nr:hypothetical protein [Pedosphaera sp.]
MKFLSANGCLLMLLLFCCLGCGNADTDSQVLHVLQFELRFQKSFTLDPKTSITLVAGHGEDGTRVQDCKNEVEGDFVVLRDEFLLFKERRPERGLIVAPRLVEGSTNAVAQVFRLRGISLAPSDWIAWRKPDYVESGSANWTFLDQSVPGRSTALPNNCFELRYKIITKPRSRTPR